MVKWLLALLIAFSMLVVLVLGIVLGRASEECDVSVKVDGQEELRDLINNYRLQNSLEPLDFEIHLEAASQWFAIDMYEKGYFDHTDSLGRDLGARLTAFGYPVNTWRVENLAIGSDPVQVFDAWVNSPGHNVNLLNASIGNVGLGIAGNIWVFDGGQAAELPPPPAITPEPTESQIILTPEPLPTETPCK